MAEQVISSGVDMVGIGTAQPATPTCRAIGATARTARRSCHPSRGKLSTGDRPTEYPALGADYANREERYREAFGLIRTLHRHDFPTVQTRHYGQLRGNLDLVPKPVARRLPMIAIGRSRQPIEWIAQNTDA